MAISRRVFFDKYLIPKLEEYHFGATQVLNQVAYMRSFYSDAAQQAFVAPSGVTWILSDSRPNREQACKTVSDSNDSLSYKMSWSGHAIHQDKVIRPGTVDLFFSTEVNVCLTTTCKLWPRRDEITVTQDIVLDSGLKIWPDLVVPAIFGWSLSKNIGNLNLNTNFRGITEKRINLSSANSDSGLQISVVETRNEHHADSHYDIGGVLDLLPAQARGSFHEWLNANSDGQKIKQEFSDGLNDHTSLMLDSLAESLEKSLVGQGRFVLPGAGTFDMKDPIFNDSGDLMIGLVYRLKQRESATEEVDSEAEP